MLTNLSTVLKDAYNNKYAVGAFNTYNLVTMQGVIEAAKEADEPVIVAFGAKYLPNMSFQTAVAIVKSLTQDMTQPVVLHLDHCSDIELIKEAIVAGFTSVMYDGSMLAFEENIANTKKVVELAHAENVSVEAELGSLSAGERSHEGTAEDVEALTDPHSAQQFVEETGVDALAVSVGTVHGLYKGEPNIRMSLLKEINEAVKTPLVLHGGSGVPQADIEKCLKYGITKMNVNTEISMHVVEETTKLLREEQPHFSELSIKQKEAVKTIVKKYISFLTQK